jgi:hypothetical protein
VVVVVVAAIVVVVVVVVVAAAATIVVVVVVAAVAEAKTRTRKIIHNTSTVNGASSYKESCLSRSNCMVYVSISFSITRSTILIGSNIDSSICGNGSGCNRNCI